MDTHVFRGLKKKDNNYYVKTWVEGYQYTHNRRIVSNYHLTTAEYGFMAFKENGLPEKEQEITIKGLYSEGLNDYSDLSALRHSHELNNVAAWIYSDTCKNLMVAEDGNRIDSEAIPGAVATIPLFHHGESGKGTFLLKGKES